MNLGGLDANRGAKRAREARTTFGLAPDEAPACLLAFVEETVGLRVLVVGLGPGVAGACWGPETAEPIIAVNAGDWCTRQRFTLAHELGHVCCGHTGRLPKDTAETFRDQDHDPREVQANAFAGELLMPEKRFLQTVGPDPSLEDLVLAAEVFNVSPQAAVVRAARMRRLDWPSYQVMWARTVAGEHAEVRDRLGCAERDDGFTAFHAAGVAHRFSPSLRGGALAAVLAGEASIEAAAARAGLDPVALARLVHAITEA